MTETPASRLRAFLTALFAATGALVLSCMLIWSVLQASTTLIRVEGAVAALITTTLMVLASALTYVRFQDWHQKADRGGMHTVPRKS